MPPLYQGGPNVGDPVFYVDGDFRVAAPCEAPRIIHPFQGDSVTGGRQVVHLQSDAGSPLGYNWFPVPIGTSPNIQSVAINQTSFIIEQEFVVAEGWYVPLPLNTPYDALFNADAGWNLGGDNPFQNIARAVLVKEGPLEDIGAGLVKFRRIYSTVPNGWSVFEGFTYNFIGYMPSVSWTAPGGGVISDGRPRFPFSVKSRLQFDYFLIDPSGLSGYEAAIAVAGIDQIPLLLEQAYLYTSGFSHVDVLFDPTNPPPPEVFGGLVPSPNQTTPSLTQYQGWVDNGYELIAEQSVLRPWMGNIYSRVTRFVVAQ